MPLNRPPLAREEIDLLRAWIDQGAKAPATESPGAGAAQRTGPSCRLVGRSSPRSTHPAGSATRSTASSWRGSSGKGSRPRPRPTARRSDPPAQPRPDRPAADARRRSTPSSPTAGPTPTSALVDRLLASPHYGERWARHWLDLARYADSNGYNIDAPRSIWKYRDWVIDALNRDMPFDQFAIEQLAGDLLPDATLDQKIATGFHRNTLINQEGGIDLEQFRVESIVDRVNTTGTVFLGLTVGCAQCHDHKYDPISQREYYQLFAFFNNVDEPTSRSPRPRSWPAATESAPRSTRSTATSPAKYPDLDERERRWEATRRPGVQAGPGRRSPGWRSTRPASKRTDEQKRALIELMLAHDPAYKADFTALVAAPVAGAEVRHHDGRARAVDGPARDSRPPRRRLHPQGRPSSRPACPRSCRRWRTEPGDAGRPARPGPLAGRSPQSR